MLTALFLAYPLLFDLAHLRILAAVVMTHPALAPEAEQSTFCWLYLRYQIGSYLD